jgi:hypothetical protein
VRVVALAGLAAGIVRSGLREASVEVGGDPRVRKIGSRVGPDVDG